jgi:hypothetical protein
VPKPYPEMTNMPCKTWTLAIKCLAFAGVAAVATANAEAGFTKVNAPPDAELSHRAILGYTYGGSFGPAGGGMNFSNGTITATRLEDFGANHDLLDQCFTGDLVGARALGRWAGYQQKLGVVAGESGAGSFHELLTVAGNGINVTGSAGAAKMEGKGYRFARGGGGELMTSLASDNRGGVDQMISYRLDGYGPAGTTTYLLAFEDLGPGTNSDWDYNDLVVEVTTADPAVAPLPPAAWSALTVLLAGGVWGSRDRLRRLLA